MIRVSARMIFRLPSQVTWAVLLFLLALFVRVALILYASFDGLYGQDAYEYFDYAKVLLDSLAQRHLPPPAFWPLGYPALTALMFLLVGVTPLAGQIASMLAGSLLAPLTFLLTGEILRQDMKNNRDSGKSDSTVGYLPASLAGLIAGLLIALGGQIAQSSVVLMADASGLFWATLSAFALIRFTRGQQARWIILCSAALAFATITRWIYGGLAAVWGLVLIADYVSKRNRRKFLLSLSLAATSGLIVLAPQLFLSIANPEPVLGHSWLVGWNPINTFQRSFDNIDGHFDYALPVGIFYAQTAYHPAYIAFPLTLFVVAGAWYAAHSARVNSTRVILLFGWIIMQYGFLAGIPYENFRFGLSYLPPLAILAGIGLAHFFGLPRVGGSDRNESLPDPSGSRSQSRLFILVLVLGFILNILWLPRPSQVIFEIKRVERDLVRELSAHASAHATVITFGPTLALRHQTSYNVIELFTATPESLADLARGTVPVYLLVDVANIESQWRGRKPQENYSYLRKAFGLQEIASIRNYALYLVGGE